MTPKPPINPIAWQTALQQYQQWNEITYQQRKQPQDKAKKWQEFLTLIEFGLKIKPEPSVHEQRQRVETLNFYYQQIAQFEQRRQRHGQSHAISIT